MGLLNTLQHMVAPLKMNKPLSYSESDNDSAEEFGAKEFAAAEALASKSRIKKVVRPGTWAGNQTSFV